MKDRKVHYAGAVRTPKMRILPGWAACCSGPKAERIRSEGAHTKAVARVTCKACLRVMAKDQSIDMGDAPVRCASIFKGIQCAHGDGHSGPHEYVEAF